MVLERWRNKDNTLYLLITYVLCFFFTILLRVFYLPSNVLAGFQADFSPAQLMEYPACSVSNRSTVVSNGI